MKKQQNDNKGHHQRLAILAKIFGALLISIGVILILGIVSVKHFSPRESAYIQNDISRSAGLSGTMNKHAPVMDMDVDESPAPSPVAEQQSVNDSVGSERMLVKRASVSIYVNDIDDSITKIRELVSKWGGYVAYADINTRTRSSQVATLTLKVPAKHLDEVVDTIKSYGDEVLQADYSFDDITNDYVDNQARLRVMKATEEQLLSLMKKAKTVDETLKVQRELDRVQQNIESLEARLKNYTRSAKMATVSVTLRIKPEKAVATEKWRPVSVFNNAVEALTDFGKSIANLVIWAVVFSPVWGGVWLIIVILKRKKQNSKFKNSDKS